MTPAEATRTQHRADGADGPGAGTGGGVAVSPATTAAPGRPADGASDIFVGAPRRGRMLAWLGLAGFVAAVLATVPAPRLGPVLFAVPIAAAVILRAQRDVVSVVTGYLLLLTLVPARMTVPKLGGAATPANALALGLAAVWIVLRWFPELGFDRRRQPARLVLLVFQWVSLLGLAVALSRPLATVEMNNAVKGVIQAVGMGGLALVLADGVRSRERLDALLKRLVVLVTAMAGMGILAFFTGFDVGGRISVPGLESLVEVPLQLEIRSEFRRVAATAEHPIEFALLLAMALPLACHYARFAPPERRRRWWAAVALLAVALPMSVSRTAVLALFVGALVVVPSWSRRERRAALKAAVVFAVVMKLAVPGLLGTLRALVLHAGQDPSVSGRTTDYELVADYFVRSPLLGRGINTFEPRLYDFLDNQFIKSALEGGVVGVAALLAVFLGAVLCAAGARHFDAAHESRDLARSLLASVLMSMASFATFDLLSFDISTGVLFLLVGALGALWRLSRDAPVTPPVAART